MKKCAALLFMALAVQLAQANEVSPITKVLQLMSDMQTKIIAEGEAEHAIYSEFAEMCEERSKDLGFEIKTGKGEVADLKAAIDEETAMVAALETKVEELTAAIEELIEKIKQTGDTIDKLIAEQAELAKAMKEATAQREKEKAQNLDTIADAKAGIAAVKAALAVLRDFYSKQEALLQTRQVPEMAEYKGMQGSSKGVIGMMEVIESDFARLEADTTAAEEQAAKEYDEFMSDATASKKVKHDDEVKLKLEKDQDEFEVSQLEKDLKANQAELDKANAYYEELKPACLVVHVDYEERAAKRKEEIAALKEAYEILDQKGN